ncbi:UDP-N-acetylglucosamine 2-epimerase (non-hydrolyzing) [Alphaproteobacteria bacterium]|nr:UDP-N-acetylglucosamine 2-epimerase (non-hydrolyzing) [Alphaproteobacteria bacterium]
MKKLKVMTVLGTRPELIRLSRVIYKLDEHCEHVIVHTGQNYDYELNEIFFQDLNIRRPDHFLDAAGKTSSQTIGKVIILVDELLEKEKPDAVLVLGDTNSCMALLAAKKRKIPTFHMEAGNRCFDMRVPEEINRKLVDHIADINLTYSNIAREYLISEGFPQDQIVKTGSPIYEVLTHQRNLIQNSKILENLNLLEQSYFLVSAHREENIESTNFFLLIDCLNKLAEKFQLPIIVSTHPRTKKKIVETNAKLNKFVVLIKPLGFNNYNKLQLSAKAVLSDSGTISEESSILNFPALNIREAHERPEAMEEASVMMVGLNIDRILQGIKILEKQSKGKNRTLGQVADYHVENVSEKIVRIVHSYTDYINRVTWKKYNYNP